MFTWTVKIIPIDIPKKIVSVNCIVVDTSDNNKEYSVSVANADISTAAKKNSNFEYPMGKVCGQVSTRTITQVDSN